MLKIKFFILLIVSLLLIVNCSNEEKNSLISYNKLNGTTQKNKLDKQNNKIYREIFKSVKKELNLNTLNYYKINITDVDTLLNKAVVEFYSTNKSTKMILEKSNNEWIKTEEYNIKNLYKNNFLLNSDCYGEIHVFFYDSSGAYMNNGYHETGLCEGYYTRKWIFADSIKKPFSGKLLHTIILRDSLFWETKMEFWYYWAKEWNDDDNLLEYPPYTQGGSDYEVDFKQYVQIGPNNQYSYVGADSIILDFQIRVYAAYLPPKVHLVSPPNNTEYEYNMPITLEWREVFCKRFKAYQVQVAEDSLFSHKVINSFVNTLSYNIDSERLPYGHTYFWRVRAKNDCQQNNGYGPWSDIRKFIILQKPPLKAKINIISHHDYKVKLLASVLYGKRPYHFQWYHKWISSPLLSNKIISPKVAQDVWYKVGDNSPELEFYIGCGNSAFKVEVYDGNNEFAKDSCVILVW